MKENPDLFDWAKERPSHVPSNTDEEDHNDLFSKCPQCEIEGGHCARHPRPVVQEKTITEITDEDIASSNRIADREFALKELEEQEAKPMTPEEIKDFFKDTFDKAS